MSRLPITREAILTSPLAFGVETATPSQRAMARAMGGLPLGNLADDPDVVDAFGGPEAIAALPVGAPPAEMHVLGPIRGCKTLGAAADILVTACEVDVSPATASDIVRITVSALKLEGTRPLMQHLVTNLHKPLLRPLVIGEPTIDRIVLRHPTGRPIEVTPVPIDRAGGSALSVWNAMAVVDEEPRQIGAEDGVRNWDEFHTAVIARILPGGKFLGTGTPHAPFGPIFDLFRERFGKPSRDCVIFRGRGRAMNPIWWTPERCAEMQRRSPHAYLSDERAEFRSIDPMSAFPADGVEAAFSAPLPSQFEAGQPILSLDLSTLKHHATAIVVIRWLWPHPGSPHVWVDGTAADGSIIPSAYPLRNDDGELVPNPAYGRQLPILQVAHVEGYEPKLGTVISHGALADRIVRLARSVGATLIVSDQYEEASFAQLVYDRDSSLRFQVFRWSGGAGGGSKGAAIDRLHALLVNRQIVFPSYAARLREELLRFRRRITQTGEVFEAAPGSTHGDYASAVITGIMADMAHCIPYSPIRRGSVCIEHDPYTDEVSYS